MLVSELRIITKDLLRYCKNHPDDVSLQQISHKIKKEEQFLQTLSAMSKYETSNIPWFNIMVQCIIHLKDDTTTIDNYIEKTKLDIISHKYKTWIKVTAMSQKRQTESLLYNNEEFSDEQSIVDIGRDILDIALKQPIYAKPTQIYFLFGNGVTEDVKASLESLGIIVTTNVNDIKLLKVSSMDAYNLDVTALMALISYTTNEATVETKFTSKILDDGLKLELETPFRSQVGDLSNKQLYVCHTALDSFKNIVDIVAGPKEKERAFELYKRLIVIPDVVSPEMKQFRKEYILDDKNVTIFGTGEANNLCTITSNFTFVNKLRRNKYFLDVLLINPYALSENKVKT
jgi:hypothetical protein